MTPLAITYDDVAAAQRRLAGIVHRTPALTSRTADAMSGARLYFKAENQQRIGAFKLRGAYNAIAQFTPQQRAGGVVTFSSGNHGQAIALAAQLLGVKAVVVMPHDAAAMKRAATQGYGAEVLGYDRYAQDPEQVLQRIAEERGLTPVPPFDHPHVMAGQGTAALELIEQVGELDLLVTPVGGGGLLSGCATALTGAAPRCAAIGVEPEAGNDGQQSLQRGEIVRIETPKTIADAAQSRNLGRHVFPVLQALGVRIVTASDEQLIEAMKFMAARMKLIVEPTGCLGVAAAFNGALGDIRGLRVGIVLSGGNVDLARFASLVGG
ncbi:threo-3-hydroxy-L-aspartate ammonia-lyase [Aquincola sp. S2]|uniref:Threo-3-hydroxy-L-aspartate ammonia-lyase n=1 Tax=Pseudaquabacterium terrae TaxID=2732868 RepID=A0ABX2EMW3_9BURK|nr:threo-3-hydroxy-L-aspartate ammonia-lyase [Aquabacterium terrae]NRF69881.1 threo-3-hydroxy-L-aspartate ammonia-lyase [Aquabacterium terrae]